MAAVSSSAFQSSLQQNQRRCVFVGNIPYDTTEEQLIQICEEVGPVVSFRLVTDRETGKPKGYGFCEYKDEETALSARRNLQGYEINGRQLRVDFADNDKNGDKSGEQGRGGPGMVMNIGPQRQSGGPAVLGDSSTDQPMGVSVAINAATVMARTLGAAQNGSFSTRFANQSQPLGSDQLTLHLAKMSRHQLIEIMSELKAMATQDKEQAHHLLLAVPNLLKAIFQAQIMLGMVTHQMLLTPSICKVAAPPIQPVSSSACQSQEAQTGPGVPPQLLVQCQGLQHGQLPMQSSVSTVPAIRPEPLGNRSVWPLAHAELSLALKPQVLVPLSQNIGQTSLSGYVSQMPSSTQPLLSDHGFQLPLEMDSALLQQVLSLTQEQLYSLPPDQQQQVIQLQQLLRQSTQM